MQTSRKVPYYGHKSNEVAECHDVKETELTSINLDDAKNRLKQLQRDKVTPFECIFSDKDERNKVSIAFCNNYCSVIRNGEEIYSGIVSDFHTLQNILKEVFGYTIYLTK